MSLYHYNHKIVRYKPNEAKGEYLSDWEVTCKRCGVSTEVLGVCCEHPITLETTSAPNYVPCQIIDNLSAQGFTSLERAIRCSKCGSNDMQARIMEDE